MECPNKNCKACNAENPIDAQYCHLCGRPLHKGKPLKLLIWLCGLIVVCISFAILSVPRIYQAKAEGEYVAGLYNDCQNNYYERVQIDRDAFVDSFDRKKYETREDAILALEVILKSELQYYNQDLKTAQSEFDKIQSRYEKKHIRRQFFEKSFHSVLKQFSPDDVVERAINDESFQSCLICLTPIKPNKEQVRRDLIWHKLKGSSDNPFFDDSWKFVIDAGNLDKVDIKDFLYRDGKGMMGLDMRVKEGGHYLKVKAKAIYELSDSMKSWELVDIITENVEIDKTLTYKNAYVVSYEPYGKIEITNKNESPLLLGIKVWVDSEDGWRSQKIKLGVDKRTTISCGVREDGGNPYRIEFVEKY